jgi:hypothetical protein
MLNSGGGRETADGLQMVMLIQTFPIDAAKAAFVEKQQNWAETKDKDADSEERARAQKMQLH